MLVCRRFAPLLLILSALPVSSLIGASRCARVILSFDRLTRETNTASHYRVAERLQAKGFKAPGDGLIFPNSVVRAYGGEVLARASAASHYVWGWIYEVLVARFQASFAEAMGEDAATELVRFGFLSPDGSRFSPMLPLLPGVSVLLEGAVMHATEPELRAQLDAGQGADGFLDLLEDAGSLAKEVPFPIVEEGMSRYVLKTLMNWRGELVAHRAVDRYLRTRLEKAGAKCDASPETVVCLLKDESMVRLERKSQEKQPRDGFFIVDTTGHKAPALEKIALLKISRSGERVHFPVNVDEAEKVSYGLVVRLPSEVKKKLTDDINMVLSAYESTQR